MKAIVLVKEGLEPGLSSVIDELFETVHVIDNAQNAIPLVYTDPPDLFLIGSTLVLENGSEAFKDFRDNPVYSHIPVVAIFPQDDLTDISWQDIPIDDFIITGQNPQTIRQRLAFILSRARRELDTSPLTRLPGNESITRYIQRVLNQGQEIAIAWADIDHFKSYNDHYGFSRGDEVILATARIIDNSVKEMQQEPSFVGHIGGDDFVFLCPIPFIKSLCEKILSRFDRVIRSFYNDEDLAQGGITTKERSGNIKSFPVTSLSIAVVMNKDRRYKYYGQASEDASGIKAYIKPFEGSNYLIDRRMTRHL